MKSYYLLLQCFEELLFADLSLLDTIKDKPICTAYNIAIRSWLLHFCRFSCTTLSAISRTNILLMIDSFAEFFDYFSWVDCKYPILNSNAVACLVWLYLLFSYPYLTLGKGIWNSFPSNHSGSFIPRFLFDVLKPCRFRASCLRSWVCITVLRFASGLISASIGLFFMCLCVVLMPLGYRLTFLFINVFFVHYQYFFT